MSTERGGQRRVRGGQRDRVLVVEVATLKFSAVLLAEPVDAAQGGDLGIEFGEGGDFADAGAEGDDLVGAAIDRDGQRVAGSADVIEQAGGVVSSCLRSRPSAVVVTSSEVTLIEKSTSALSASSLSWPAPSLEACHQIGAAGADHGVDLVDDQVDVVGGEQRHRVVGAAHGDDEIAVVAGAERGAETGAGDGAERFVDRIAGERDRRVAGGGRLWRLPRLLGDRLCGFDQLGQRGDAVVGGLERFLRLADRVEQRVQVARAIAERLRGEEVARIVERRVDLLAGREPVLRRGHEVGGVLQRQQVLSNAGGKDDVAHDEFPLSNDNRVAEAGDCPR